MNAFNVKMQPLSSDISFSPLTSMNLVDKNSETSSNRYWRTWIKGEIQALDEESLDKTELIWIRRHQVKTKTTKFGTKSSAKHQIPLMHIAQNSFQKSFKLQKVVNDSRKSGWGLLMLKVDFKTACDSVNWEGIFGDVEAMNPYLSSIFKNSRAGNG